MSENIITWNATNWVTILLMAAGGFFVLGAITKFLQSKGFVAASPTATGS